MSDLLTADIKELATELAGGPEEVCDLMENAARLYRQERHIILGMIAVDSMVTDGPEEIDEQDPRLVKIRETLRDRLRALLAWARSTKRMC